MGLLDLLVMHEWWQYNPADPLHQAYHFFNLAEGFVWIIFAVLVTVRWSRFGRSRIELLYALAFVTFGLTDFREAHRLESWLILAKGVNLAMLLWLRWIIIRRYYPTSKLY